MVCFGLLLGNHILGITGFVPCEEIHATFAAMQRWLDGQANYHESRSIDCDTAVCGKTRGLQATWLKSASSEQCIRLPASRIASTTLYGRRILR
jgi:hypothetical protein